MKPTFQVFDLSLPNVGLGEFLTKHVWPIIRPEWTEQELVSQRFPIGEVNQLTLYRTAEDVEVKGGVVVRVNSKDMREEKYDELVHMQVSHRAGCHSAVRAAFHNGVIYDFMPGQFFDINNLGDPELGPKMARSIARLHWINTDSFTVWDRQGQVVQFSKKPNFTNKMWEVLRNDPYEFTEKDIARAKEVVRIDERKEEVEFVESYLEGLDLPTVNSHDDFHAFNIICDPTSGAINFIDYEMSGYHSPATIDLSYILCLGAYNNPCLAPWFDFADLSSLPDRPASDDVKRMWLTEYLEEKHAIEGADDTSVSNDELELWFAMMQITDVLCHFQRNSILLHAVQLTTKSERVGCLLEVYNLGIQLFKQSRERLSSIRERYLELKAKSNKEK